MGDDTGTHERSDLDDEPLRQLTMNHALENRAERVGDDHFVRYGPEARDVSFSEMNRTANAVGTALCGLGVEPGENVSVMVRHPLRTLFAMFGIHKAGGVYAPINFEYQGDVLAYQLDDTAPEVLVLADRYAERLNDVRDDLSTLPHVVLVETEEPSEPLSDDFEQSSFAAALESEPTKPDVTVSWDDAASIVYTSGTTGRPKGVVLPHRWIFANYTRRNGQLLSRDDVTHTTLPLYHVGGVYADVAVALLSGSAVGLWDRFSPHEFWDRVERYGATKTILLSVMMPWLMDQPEREDDHRNTLNKVHMQPLPENYAEIADRFGFDVVTVGFGQTESGAPLSGAIHAGKEGTGTPADLLRGTPPSEAVAQLAAAGTPVVDGVSEERYMGRPSDDVVEVAVLGERDERLPAGEVGELAVRPKAPGVLMQEYYGKPERTVEAWRNLWFHTGDAVYRDEAGDFYFVDRIGDVIRRRGENVSSIQIQDAATAHGDVAQAAAFPVPAAEGGEDEIGLAVELAGDVGERALESFLADRLPGFMVPDHLFVVDEIPTTETNKMEKYRLREQAVDDLDR